MLFSGGLGVALLTVLLLRIFGQLTWQASLIYMAVLFILVEILFIYKSFVTFFNRASDFFFFFLYFCALEMISFVGLVGFFVMYHYNI